MLLVGGRDDKGKAVKGASFLEGAWFGIQGRGSNADLRFLPGSDMRVMSTILLKLNCVVFYNLWIERIDITPLAF